MPKPDQAKGVQIDLDPQQVGLRLRGDVGLIRDSKRALQILMPLLKRKQDRSFLKKAQEGAKQWWKIMEERASRRDKPMKPQLVAWELGKRLSSNAIVSCDSGTITTCFARNIHKCRSWMYAHSRT